jgi:hypothetical protein
MTDYIYALVDPRTNEIRYIGRTGVPKARFRTHLKKDKNPGKSEWVAGLLEIGLQPKMVILEEIPTIHRAHVEREDYWIHRMIDEGCNLFNINYSGSEFRLNIGRRK